MLVDLETALPAVTPEAQAMKNLEDNGINRAPAFCLVTEDNKCVTNSLQDIELYRSKAFCWRRHYSGGHNSTTDRSACGR